MYRDKFFWKSSTIGTWEDRSFKTEDPERQKHQEVELPKTKSLEKEMATHSSILAWKNPWTEESGGLKSMGLHD